MLSNYSLVPRPIPVFQCHTQKNVEKIGEPGDEASIIIESVDSISRDGPDIPIYAIQNKKPKYSVQIHF